MFESMRISAQTERTLAGESLPPTYLHSLQCILTSEYRLSLQSRSAFLSLQYSTNISTELGSGRLVGKMVYKGKPLKSFKTIPLKHHKPHSECLVSPKLQRCRHTATTTAPRTWSYRVSTSPP
ncbi:hypothetical protein I3842_01G094900 [Carya illinoinensis]|uniref:Uncharacterized protein n=1 Tax=Carya illinoinensis TaxID=32201 RepID=A0A922G1Q2_CARIL|nr:hypothetical protein I3842_01G094900 [Carya illinoinensis]